MDNAQNKHPRQITDEHEAICAYCHKQIYLERIVGILQEDNTYKYHKEVFGSFKQDCDAEGIPTGPVIPSCNCRNKGK